MDPISPRAFPPATRALPTGTVTFLFTDIEGSTQRWEAKRDAMKAAVARHDGLMRGAIEASGGYVFKTIGDAFCAAFRTAPEAIRAALAAQRALAKEDFSAVDLLRVRAALHSGYADERDGDYFGPTVNRVARLLSIGHGGQVLVSGTTADLAEGELPPQTSLRDLGAHRLKDLAHPEHVFQIVTTDMPAEFAPLRSLDALPNNLPLQVTSFVGREIDLDEVKKLVEKTRLITLVGPGGVGKTRLALQAGADLLDNYPEGVWVIQLAALTDPELLPSEAAAVLNVRVSSDRSLTDSIVYALKPKRSLLILDNCEHIVAAAAAFVGAVSRGCPNVHILATSREGLGIEGEDIMRVASLSVPAKGETLTAETASQYGAVALFSDRATMSNKSFILNDENSAAVADICRRLDGIPFAIELAAARVKSLSIADLSHALNERFRILTGGHRSALPRQKTMRALIDWSFDLLSDSEKTLLRRVSIFAGGWTLDAATQICQGEGSDEIDILDLLSSLVDKSLVVAETGGMTTRYRLLDSTREYALEKLAERDERQRLSRAHAKFFSMLATKADHDWGTAPTNAVVDQLEPELDNFRGALEWALNGSNDASLGALLAGHLGVFWFYGGLNPEGMRWIDNALAQVSGQQPAAEAALWLARARLLESKLALEAAEQARALFESLGNRGGAGRAMYLSGTGLRGLGRLDEAETNFRQAADIMGQCGDKKGYAMSIGGIATVNWIRGEAVEAYRQFDEQRRAADALMDDDVKTMCLANLAELEFSRGNVEQAIANSLESIGLQRKNYLKVALDYCNLTAYRIAAGQVEQARNDARAGLHWAQEVQNAFQVGLAIHNLALIAALKNDARRAATLLGFAESSFAAVEYVREPTETICYERLMGLLRKYLREDEIEAMRAEGASWSENRAIEEALKV